MNSPYDFVTVNDVKQYAPNVLGSALDELIGQLITVESAFIEDYLDRNVIDRGSNLVEYYDGENCAMLPLASWPITAVSSVVVDGVAWLLANTAGQIGYSFSQRFLLAIGQWFPSGFRKVQVTYRAGYTQDTVPQQLKQACIELVTLRLEERKRQGTESKTLAGEQVTFTKDSIPKAIKARLDGELSFVAGAQS